jgi:hypothetical protein
MAIPKNLHHLFSKKKKARSLIRLLHIQPMRRGALFLSPLRLALFFPNEKKKKANKKIGTHSN